MANSTRGRSAAKSPAKKPAFPLWLHSHTGQWCKKIRGHRRYFGTDRDKALAEYLRVKDDLQAGRIPPPVGCDRVTLLYVVNAYLTHQRHKVQTGELAERSFADYHRTCELLLAHLGKTTAVESIGPAELLAYRRKLAETRQATSLGNEVNRARIVLRFAFANGLTNTPIRFGEFKRPSKHVLRRQRAEKGPRMFEPTELQAIIAAADVQLRAAVLLGINCGFGPHDVGTLPLAAVDLPGGWLDYARPKTGVARRCPLWPETIVGLQAIPPQSSGLVFERRGYLLARDLRQLLDTLGLYRPGLSFYTLRHVFQTVADECGDYIATKKIMGHVDSSMSDTYRERFPDERLRKVSDHVRAWLFGEGGEA